MFLQISLGLSLLGLTLAVPPATTPSPVLPSICGVLSNEPACPAGYTCQPIPRFCTDLDPDDVCGGCVSNTAKSTSTPTSTPCPSGYTRDYRNFCHTIYPTTSSKSSTFTCASGFTPDYRGYSYCRTVYPTTTSGSSTLSCASGYTPDYRGYSWCRLTVWPPPTTTTPTTMVMPTTTINTCISGMTPDYRGLCHSPSPTPVPPSTRTTCSPGWTTDYRGHCRAPPTPASTSSAECVSGSYQDYRGMCRSFTHTFTPVWTTATATAAEKVKRVNVEREENPVVKCDTRRDPVCPDGLRCVAVKWCPPFTPFCAGTCVPGGD
ncbi:hypothetical protein BCR34DRAFT_590599 [Clohesyomyces aquaticus]|uniref:Uncharacterized protein n=1 Tax=Clohesyomyces aquaticus TaxID=1231657 RepID=A0A1Y1Z8E2_9PLEO|nr:hypothetical protein BCR34DRAFT_590599 [Clohesyomyces aquaticus]